MSLPLPWSFSKDDPAGPDLEDRLQEQFDKIAISFPDLGGASLAFRVGSNTVTWAGATPYSGNAIVNHGLGGVPATVVCMGANPSGFGWFVFENAARTTTTFTVQGCSPVLNPAAATVGTFYWLAIA